MKPGDINLASSDDMRRIGGVPNEYFEVLRREAPVHWNPDPKVEHPILETMGFWVLSKHEDVAMVSKDSERFSAWENGVIWVNYRNRPEALAAHRSGLMGMDPPQHTPYRRLMQSGFTPRSVAAMEPVVRKHAAGVIDSFVDRGSGEFVIDVASELPMIMLCEMMGVPQERRSEYFELANGTASVEFNERFIEDQINLFVLLAEVSKDHGSVDDDTLLGKYLNGEIDGRKLTEIELTSFFQTLSIAGYETTRNSTVHFVRLMDDYPDQKALLLEDLDARLPNAIEEVLRFSPPVMQFCRTATEDLTIRGVEIAEGDKVYMSYVSANRDEEVFDDPNTFDILRPNADRHLAFGTGAHFCLGASFARLQLRCLLTELYTQAPEVTLTAPPTPMYSVWFNGITDMPVATCPVAH